VADSAADVADETIAKAFRERGVSGEKRSFSSVHLSFWYPADMIPELVSQHRIQSASFKVGVNHYCVGAMFHPGPLSPHDRRKRD